MGATPILPKRSPRAVARPPLIMTASSGDLTGKARCAQTISPARLEVRARPTRKSSKRIRPSPRVKGSSMSKDDLVVVTGAGGFIGGHLSAELTRRGARVRATRGGDVKPVPTWFQKHVPRTQTISSRPPGDRDACYRLVGRCTTWSTISPPTWAAWASSRTTKPVHALGPHQHPPADGRPQRRRQRFFYASSACVYNADKKRLRRRPLKEEDAYPAMPEDGYG